MITIDTRHGTVDMSVDLQEYYRTEVGKILKSDDIEFLDGRIKAMTEVEFEAIAKYLQRNGYPTPNRTRILDSHGNVIDGEFQYVEVQDGKQIWTPVNKWIDEHDGRYDALFVASCNPDGVKLDSRKSFIIYPLDINTGREIMFASHGLDSGIPTIVPPTGFRRHASKDQPRSLLDAMLETYNIKTPALDSLC